MDAFPTGFESDAPPNQPPSLAVNQPYNFVTDFRNASEPQHNRGEEASLGNVQECGSTADISRQKRSIGLLHNYPNVPCIFEGNTPGKQSKRICRDEDVDLPRMDTHPSVRTVLEQLATGIIGVEEAYLVLTGKQYSSSPLNIEPDNATDSQPAVKQLESDAVDDCTTELEEQLRKAQDALHEERDCFMKVIALRFELCRHVSGSTSNCSSQTEQAEPSMTPTFDREILLWDGPFQYAKLSCTTPLDCLKYQDRSHLDSLQTRIIEFQKCGSLCDSEIRGRGSTFATPCHSLVLCAVSSVIKTRLSSKLHRGGSGLNFNIPHEILIPLVDFVYTGRIALDEVNILSVYTAADFLDIKSLVTATTTFLSEITEKFDGVSCYKVLRFLDQYDGLKLLIPMYKRRVMEHIADLFNCDDCLMDMSFEFVVEVLESDDVDFGPETDVVRALSRRVAVDSSRECYLAEFAARIRWSDIDRNPSSEGLKVFMSKLESTGGSSIFQPRIGSRNGGLSGGYLMSCNEERIPMLLDIQSKKIKVLPEYPELVYKGRTWRDELLHAESDDGAFYVVSVFGYDGRTPRYPNRFDLFRLNVPEKRWDLVLCREGGSDRRETLFGYSILAGKLYISGRTRGDKGFVVCVEMTTSDVEFRIDLDDPLSGGTSVGLCSIFFLQERGKVTRFDTRTNELSEVKVDIPLDQLRGCREISVNPVGQAVLYDGHTQFWVCLKSGRLLRSEARSRCSSIPVLIQNSIVSLGESYPRMGSMVKISRDRGPLAGWNAVETCPLSRHARIHKCCHFTRELFRNLPDFT